MIPQIQKISLVELTPYARKKICGCKKPCEEGIMVTTYNDGLILCWNDARKTLYNMIAVLDGGGYTSWTKQDEQFIIDHYEKRGMYRGFNRYIAESLGKTYQQVKSKTRKMKAKGLLK